MLVTYLKSALPPCQLGLAGASPLLAIWVMLLAAMPVVQWAPSHGGFFAPVILGVLLQASLVVLLLAQATGLQRSTRIALRVGAAAWLAETAGVRNTPLPFAHEPARGIRLSTTSRYHPPHPPIRARTRLRQQEFVHSWMAAPTTPD